jgi:hypothetical protein
MEENAPRMKRGDLMGRWNWKDFFGSVIGPRFAKCHGRI